MEEAVSLMLEYASDEVVNAKSSDGTTALHRAALMGHDRILRLLLEKGARIDDTDSEGGTALMIASANNSEATYLLHVPKSNATPTYFLSSPQTKPVDC